MSIFREIVGIYAIFGSLKKFQTLRTQTYIILKWVIWRCQIYNLFREIFKFREDISNNVFREILKCFRKTTKFGLSDKFSFRRYIICWGNSSFSKIIGGGGGGHPAPPHPFILQNCVQNLLQLLLISTYFLLRMKTTT